MLISLIVELVDPPETKGPQPTMSADLQKALGVIKKVAQERMDALQAKKEQLESSKLAEEVVPKLIGHIEKVEEKISKKMWKELMWFRRKTMMVKDAK